MLPFRAKVDLSAMAFKRHSAFLKIQCCWNLTIRFFRVTSRTLVCGVLLLYCHLLIHARIYIYILDTYRRNEQQTQEDFFSKNIYLSLYCKGSKRGYSRFACERELEIEQKLQYFDPKLMAVNVVSFSFSWAAQPEAQGPLCWATAFFIASYQHLLWTPTHEGLKAPSA